MTTDETTKTGTAPDDFHDLAEKLGRFQILLSRSGNTPNIEAAVLTRLVEMMTPDADDAARERFRDEIRDYLDVKKEGEA